VGQAAYVVSTYAGSGASGMANGSRVAASFMAPVDLRFHGNGDLYVLDNNARQVRIIEAGGQVRTLAGNGQEGNDNGPGINATFRQPRGLELAPDGTVFVADGINHQIRKITPSGVVSTFAGSTFGFADGTGNQAMFDGPTAIVRASDGNYYITDRFNERVRKMTPEAVVTTVVKKFDVLNPSGLAIGADLTFFVSQIAFHKISKVAPDGTVSLFAGSFKARAQDGPPFQGAFDHPTKMALGPDGNLYVADTWNHRIRLVTPDGSIATLAGSGPTGQHDGGFADGPGNTARFFRPCSLTFGPDGALYVADSANHRIRKIVKTP
jgi:sugar lactone lactonase YvrE